ncbi:MFS transporter [Caballeronia concitans]|uniref:Major facilitator transporter n=1 Tax=Caballeronia concitans TaxID=1777133 RepID=A0A658R5A6_9BURK|nr:MFS transporter [Caballeronia concitans]KIG01643.1 major facilitator superfamily MFS_1 [Burkholderia sp. MR1]SAL52135.1 major facilitator transporter [Caballeronia concitans]
MSTNRVQQGSATMSALYRRINWRLLPLLIACYMFAYLDRVNVGFAKLQMQSDLGFSDAAYGVGAGIFFIGYVLFEIPSNLLLPKIGARLTFSRILVLWGVTSACMLFVHSVPAFYAMRFLLGVFEAGFAPGMIYYLSRWYGPKRMARAIALVFVAGPIGGVVGGPLSAWLISSLGGVVGLAGWQWMFLVEGLPCIALGALVWFALADRPADARWLTQYEQSLVQAEVDDHGGHAHRIDSFAEVVKNPRVYLLALAYFCIIFPIYAISFWLPTLLREQGVHDTIRLGWYVAIPYVAAAIAMYAAGRRSDKVGERRYHSALPALASAALLALTPYASGNLIVTLTLLTLATACMWMAYTVFWAIPSETISGPAAAGSIALINTIGLLGGFWGPAALGWVKSATGSANGGLLLMACMAALSCVLILTNKRTIASANVRTA